MKILFLLHILFFSSFYHAHSIEIQSSTIEQSIETEKALVGYQLDRLSQVKSTVPIQNSISSLKWISKTQVPQYLTEKNTLKVSQNGLNTKAISSNLFHYALTVAGIGASTAILDDYSKTGEIHLDKSLDFLADSNFLKNSMGIFIGSTAFSILGNFLPPGVGTILKTVPGFLGASVGLSVSSKEKINWPKVMLSSLVSSAAFVALGSGGLLAIGAGIAASMASDAIFDSIQETIKNKEELPDYVPKDYFEDQATSTSSDYFQMQSTPKYVEHQASQKSSINPQQHQKLLQEIQTSASQNELLKTKALLNSLDNFGNIR